MPKSCKPPPTIYFAASSRSREGVSTGHLGTGPQRPTPDPPPRYRPPEGRSCRSGPGLRALWSAVSERSALGGRQSAGLYGSPALHLRA